MNVVVGRHRCAPTPADIRADRLSLADAYYPAKHHRAHT